MVSAIFGGPLHVRVFDDRDERQSRIVDVQPVRVAQAAIQTQNQADVRQVDEAFEPCAIILWQPGRHVREQCGRGGDQDAIVRIALSASVDSGGAPVLDENFLDGEIRANLHAHLEQPVTKRLNGPSEAALEIAEVSAWPLPREPPRSFNLFQIQTAATWSAYVPNFHA